MPTARQIAAQQRRARQDLERDRRKRDRAALKQLRTHIRNAKRLQVQRMREIRSACKRGKITARERAKAIRAHYRAEAAAAIARELAGARTVCDVQKTRARARAANALERAAAALQREHAHQQQMKVWERKKPLRKMGAELRQRAAERIQESDAEVANNLTADMLPVWRAVRSRIKGSPRQTRTEAFYQWAHDHPGDVLKIQDRQYMDDVAELVKNEAELRQRVRTPRAYRRMNAAELADVPF